MNADKALKLIKEHGVFGLAYYDGCLCTSFLVQGISVDIQCRKGSRCDPLPMDEDFRGTIVRVSGDDPFYTLPELKVVADEIVIHLYELESTEIKTRLCSYEFDKQCTCLYCGKPREEIQGYFCNEHKDYAGDL